MKNIIFSLASVLLVTSVSAHTIKGTMILKGQLKTSVQVGDKKETCKVKIEKVANLKYQDAFGNPGYTVKVQGDIGGKADLSKDFTFINIFGAGDKTETRDLEYFSNDNASMIINEEGRLVKITLPTKKLGLITCVF